MPLTAYRYGRLNHRPRLECGFFLSPSPNLSRVHGTLVVINQVFCDKPLFVYGSQVTLAREWFGEEYVKDFQKKDAAIGGEGKKYRCLSRYELYYEIDSRIATEARNRGYDLILYIGRAVGRIHEIVLL